MDSVRSYFESQTRAHVAAAFLFGSLAEGRAHRESDVDLAVLLDYAAHPGRDDRAQRQLSMLSDLIAVLHRNEVDLVVLNDAAPHLARHIVRAGIPIFLSDRAALHAFVRDVQLRAADLTPFLERGRRRVLEALRR